MPMPYPPICPTFCPTKVEIFTRSVRHCPQLTLTTKKYVRQPYTELVVAAGKKIELRKWNTQFRGEFLVHTHHLCPRYGSID